MVMKISWCIMIFIISLCSLITVVAAAFPQNASVSWDSATGHFTIYDHIVSSPVAVASFEDKILDSGWSYLKVKTYEAFNDSVQAYAAGLAEGYLTQNLLSKHWNNVAKNYCVGEEAYCKRLQDYLSMNLMYVNSQITRQRDYSPYWHQVALVLEQLSGMEDAFHNVTRKPRTDVDVMGFMLINIMGDLIDLEKCLGRTISNHPLGSGSCSGLVKVLPNNKDIYFSHDTWASYSTMLRILKKYDFGLHTQPAKGAPLIPGKASSFSSQPGAVCSIDDFYLLSSGLAAMETTIANENNSLCQYVTPKGAVLEWIRSVVANRLAKDGAQWISLFSTGNSGTYNNQWMVLDYKKFSHGQPLPDGLLHVAEQLPGYIHHADVTDVLRNQGYWPSYNIPYFADVFNLSGREANVEKYGDWFTYEKNPRGLIFKRDHVKIHDIPSMIKVMRYNDYTRDPLSRCNCTPPYSADNAIASRCDLNPKDGIYPFEALGHSPVGATDMKLTTSSLFQKLQFIAIAGPTHDPLPPFQWSKSDYDKTLGHEGHPDLWTFSPIIFK